VLDKLGAGIRSGWEMFSPGWLKTGGSFSARHRWIAYKNTLYALDFFRNKLLGSNLPLQKDTLHAAMHAICRTRKGPKQ